MLKILFSESEEFYRDLGLIDIKNHQYIFDGMKLYNKDYDSLRNYDLFICAFYTLPHNTILTIKFNEINKKTVLVCDGIVDISNSLNNPMVKKYNLTQFFPIIQDYFVFPYNKENFLFNEHVSIIHYMPHRIISQKKKLPIPSEKKILITTANTAYFNENEYSNLIVLLKEILSYFNNEKILYSIRLFDKKILNDISNLIKNIKNDIDKPFEDTLLDYSSVISTPSSIVITSMYHNRSVGQLIYRDTPQLIQSGWLFPNLNVLKNSFFDFSNLNIERMTIQEKILNGYLKSNDTLNSAISKIIKDKKTTDNKHIINHINQQQFNMVNSVFNFNIEYFIRKAYNKLKRNKFIQWIRLRVK
ncbi:hypothetical protein [Providencia heimbachae]|uniref:Polysaccharide pyruvyl transferase domain-containing protein n=1 Tax=Providencia heimbachae ATCC 35613 TaxID=1354272 RepID=A0A1B7JUN4_9GAMM|nr:hypothetical protein [Providencia heimbachae]OAT51424.1 hypothetical protein M998_2039 [Providencia heimbachae ATCC 35613]SQH15823.1 Uncharacterised protein [Providencia heimbachae]